MAARGPFLVCSLGISDRYRRWLDPSQAELWQSGVVLPMGRGRSTVGRSCITTTAIWPGSPSGGTARSPPASASCRVATTGTDWVSTYPFRPRIGARGALTDGHRATKGDVVIGNDVWIGNDTLILSGVTIGDGAVVSGQAT